MKKLTAVSLILMMFLSVLMLSSCGEVTAYSLVTDAQEKMNKLDSYEMDMDVTITVDMGTMSGTIPYKINTKASGLMGENPVSLSTATVINETMVTYTEGDWIYTVSGGVGTKSRVDNEMMERLSSTVAESLINNPFSEEMMQDVEIMENEDGTRSVSVPMSDDTFEGLFDSILDEIFSDEISEAFLAVGIEDIRMSFTDVVTDFTVNEDGYFVKYDMSGNLVMGITASEEAGGTSVSMEMPFDMSCTYKNPGTAVTVTPPTGYQDFPEESTPAF